MPKKPKKTKFKSHVDSSAKSQHSVATDDHTTDLNFSAVLPKNTAFHDFTIFNAFIEKSGDGHDLTIDLRESGSDRAIHLNAQIDGKNEGDFYYYDDGAQDKEIVFSNGFRAPAMVKTIANALKSVHDTHQETPAVAAQFIELIQKIDKATRKDHVLDPSTEEKEICDAAAKIGAFTPPLPKTPLKHKGRSH